MSDATTPVPAGLLLIGLGAWNSLACCAAFSALSPNAPPPDSPLLGTDLRDAIADLAAATAPLVPVDGAVASLAMLSGLMLVAAGALVLARAPIALLVGRLALWATLVVTAIQALWGVAWSLLTWDAMEAYVAAVSRTLEDGDPAAIPATTVVVVLVSIAVTLGGYGIKAGVAWVGLRWLARPERSDDRDRRGPADEPSDAGAASSAGWAIDPPTAD